MNLLPRSTVALALSALGLAAARPGRFGVITGHSMSPTLHHGEIVWVEAVDPDRPEVHRGDVVVFRRQGRTYVKRVYATEGERVLMLAEVGDAQPALTPIRPDAEEWTALALRRCPGPFRFQRLRVPPGTFYALGDALTNSIDSRSLGPIPVNAIVGRVHPLLGRLRNVDLAMAPLRPAHAALECQSVSPCLRGEKTRMSIDALQVERGNRCGQSQRRDQIRTRRSAAGTPRRTRRGPWRPPP
jgi:signal peptidase I